MISFPFSTSPDIEVMLGALPAPRPSTYPMELMIVDESKVLMICRGRVVHVWKFDPSMLKDRFHILKSVPFGRCDKPKFMLQFDRTARSGKRFLQMKKLQFDGHSDRWSVATNSEDVQTWLKNCRVAVSRFTRRTGPTLASRTPRPSPEETFYYGRRFRQVGPTVYENTQKGPFLQYRRSWSGSNTPGFGKLKKRYLPVNNHMVDIESNVDSGFVQVYVDNVSPQNSQVFLDTWVTKVGHLPPGLVHNPVVATLALERLVEQMGQKLDAGLAQDMAQFGQLSSMMNSTVSRLTKSISFLKRKNFSGAIKALWQGTHRDPRYRTAKGPSFTADLANNWLELQYGWKPLLMDIDGSMRSLALFYQQPEHVVKSATASATKETITNGIIYDDAIHVTKVGEWFNQTSTRVRMQLRYKIDSRLKAFLAQTGFTNPVNLFWEVLPYSFVVDWFLPIGNYLQSLSSFDGLVFVDGCKTSFSRQLWSGTISSSCQRPPYAPWTVIHDYGSYERERVILNRVKLTSFPRPNMPAFKNPISTVHVLNGLALMRGAFGR